MRRQGPKDWTPSRSMEKKLRTEALDNHGYRYAVWLIFDHNDTMGWKWILRIDNTPGSWYMSTLIKGGFPRGERIAVDAGQNWVILNFGEILAEAVTLI